MKKKTTMALLLAMALSLSACGSSTSDSDSSTTDNSVAETTEADPYEGMTRIKFDQDFNGINAYFYIPKWEFELSSSRYDQLAMNYYNCTDTSMSARPSIKTNIEFIPESKKELDESGYELYTNNDNGYEAKFKYNEEASSARYEFFKAGGPDDSIIKFTVELGSLFNVEKADLDEIFDVVGKSATIEGEYSDTASAGNENGELTTDDGLLTFPSEIEIKGQKIQLEKKLLNGMMKIVGETPEIDGVSYKITIHGKSDEANYNNLLNGKYVTDKFGKETTVADYTAAALLYIREGRLNSNYFVKLDDSNIKFISFDGLKTDFDTYSTQLESDYDSLAATYNELVSELLKSATVNTATEQ